MKTILCYGDSNTWGCPPDGSGRYGWDVRWPGALQALSGREFRVIEEGLNGRTTCIDDPHWPDRNGRAYLPVVLETHCPLDLLVVLLGTNDLKAAYNRSARQIAAGAADLLTFAARFQPVIPHILLVSPAPIVPVDGTGEIPGFEGALEKSAQLSEYYRQVATELRCRYFDAGTAAVSSPLDGIHLDANSHKRLAQALYGEIRSLFAV